MISECPHKSRCWSYHLLPCILKKDSCDLIPLLKNLGNYLYEDTVEDARLEMEYGDLGLNLERRIK